jgi:hypothetical protein
MVWTGPRMPRRDVMHACASMRHHRATTVRRPYHGVPGSQHMSEADVRLGRALQDAASAGEPSATQHVRAHPRMHDEGCRTPRINAPDT